MTMYMTRRFLPIAACLVLLLPSCRTPEEPKDPSGTSRTTLIATQLDTRTAIDKVLDGAYKIKWNATDRIWVRSAAQASGTPGTCFTTTETALTDDGRTAAFTGDLLNTGPYLAVYPYAAVADGSTNARLTLNVPQEQTYQRNSFGDDAYIAVASWESGDRISFSALTGLMQVTVKGEADVSKVVLTGADPDFPLWGACTVSFDGGGTPSLSWENESAARNKLVINCPEAVRLNMTVYTTFYFVLPAGALAQGYAVTLQDAAGKSVKTFATEKGVTVNRNQVLKLETVVIGDTGFSGGAGTASDPYLIAAPEDISQLASLCNGTQTDKYSNLYYKLICDLDMQGAKPACIGNLTAKAFKGVFDGNGHTILNLAPVAAEAGSSGLFGYLDGATVKDLTVEGYTNSGKANGQGVIAGTAKNATITNCHVNARVHFTKCATGGIVGQMEGGLVEGCSVEGFIQNEDYDTFQGVTVCSVQGGIAGYLEGGEIRSCTFKGDITCGGEQLGGIVGEMRNGTVKDCSVLEGSTVTGDNYYVGGIAGEILEGGLISGCSVQADVVCWYPGAAGIVAWVQSADIRDCVVGSNSIIRSGMDKAAGIVAYIYHSGAKQTVNIDGCTVYARTIAANYSVGGIVGDCQPTSDGSVINVSNCAFLGGELINAGYHKSNWSMSGGLIAWIHMGSAAATVNIVNCFSDPSAIRADFPQPLELDLGGFIGEQGGANGSVTVAGCYNTLTRARTVINAKGDIPSNYHNYGAAVGNPTKTDFDHVYYSNTLPALGTANAGSSVEAVALSGTGFLDGTLLAGLNAFQKGYTGPLTLKPWVAGANGLPVFQGMTVNPSTGKKRPLRVSLIGDSLSTFDGYAPHGYHKSNAVSGYRCHYPTGDGDVTSAAQTYWGILTNELLSNAVWDTNLGFSGTAVTRCTNTSYSDKYWYGQDFCARYIENGGMGSPDIVIINGGANDWAHNIYNILGNVKLARYPSTTPHRPGDAAMNAVYAVADACKTLDDAKKLPDGTFIEAYVKLVKMIILQYPHVKIIVLIHDTLTPDVEESLLHIADHYKAHCRAVDLYAVNGFNDFGWDFEYLKKGYQPNMPKHDLDWSTIVTTGDLRQNSSDHYSAKAMRFIAEKIYNETGAWLEEAAWNDSAAGSISDYDNINGAW